MRRSLSLYGYGDARHPHILLVVAVSNPQVAVGRRSVALLNTASVLRTVVFVVSAVSFRRNLTVHEIKRSIFQSVAAQRDSQRPSVFRRVIHRGIRTVRESLPPNLTRRGNKSVRPLSRSAPRVSAVAADGGQSVFPQTHLPSVG